MYDYTAPGCPSVGSCLNTSAPHLLQRGQTLHTAPQALALRPTQVLRHVAQPRRCAVGRWAPLGGSAQGVLQELAAIAGGSSDQRQGNGAAKNGEAT